jgi:hypothetical protein
MMVTVHLLGMNRLNDITIAIDRLVEDTGTTWMMNAEMTRSLLGSDNDDSLMTLMSNSKAVAEK